MNGVACRDCGQDHQSGGEALDCTERMADSCGCGSCFNCHLANWWRLHPQYVEWKIGLLSPTGNHASRPA